MAKKTLPLSYEKRPSKLQKNTPLLVLLHGYGSDENDLYAFANELPEELFIISLRAPYPLEPHGYAWYAINFDAQQNKWNDVDQAKTSMETIIECIDIACEKYDLNPKNISLLGFSQGCILSMALAINFPEKFKNIVGLSGYISPEFLENTLQPKNYNHLDFYCSHGSSDQVIPVEWARKTPAILKKLGIKHTYSEFPVGHGVAPQNFFELKDWLQKRI